MRRLLPALLAAVAASCPAVAFAADPWLSKAMATLERAGVTVVSPTVCPQDVAGLYMPLTRSMMVCPQALQSSALLRETLVHEMVHVAQHCAAVHMRQDNMMPVTEFLRALDPSLSKRLTQMVIVEASAKVTSLAALVQDSSEPHAWMLEAEAYAFESQPEAVVDITATLCSGGNPS